MNIDVHIIYYKYKPTFNEVSLYPNYNLSSVQSLIYFSRASVHSQEQNTL